MNKPKRILAAIDLGADAEPVLARTADFAKHYGSDVTVMHVVEVIAADLSSEYILPQLQDIQNQLQTQAKRRLHDLAHRADLSHARVVSAQGSTKGELSRYARDNQIDLIVIGSHSRHGLARLLGSTAIGVLHGAPCDVYVVRLPESQGL